MTQAKRPPVLLPILVALLACAPMVAGAQVVTLRFAANVPVNSPWDIGLRKLAAEWSTISGGRVRLTFPQSIRNASEEDILQKMHFSIDGAILTATGLATIYPDSLVLSMPSVIKNEQEFDAVLASFVPLIRSKIADRFELVTMNKAGWIRFFSNQPIQKPADLRKLRIAVGADQEKIARIFKSEGVRTVNADLGSIVLLLNSNGLDAFYTSPIFVATLWSQFRKTISDASAFRVAPFFGVVLFSKESWSRVPAELRPALIAAAEKMGAQISMDTDRLETEALDAMKGDGLRVAPLTQDDEKSWQSLYAEERKSLLPELFSKEVLGELDKALGTVRKAP